jgi:hypothetical protein
MLTGVLLVTAVLLVSVARVLVTQLAGHHASPNQAPAATMGGSTTGTCCSSTCCCSKSPVC